MVLAYHTPRRDGNLKELASIVLLVLGMVLVFSGLTTALGLTALGMFASVAAMAALLFAGAMWFGYSPKPVAVLPSSAMLVFDRDRRIVSGVGVGGQLTAQFPEMLRAEIDRRSAAALAGTPARFPCLHNGRMVVFDALPIRGADGAILFGVLLSSEAAPAAVVTGV